MKKLISLLVTTVFTLTLMAQNEYNDAVKKGIESFHKAGTIDEWNEVINTFVRIADAEPDKWIPLYYTAHAQTVVAFMVQNPEDKEKYTSEAQKRLDKALKLAPEESELHTLQGLVYQAIIGIDPMKNGQAYSGMAATSFSKASHFNPNNPRPYYLQGLSLLHTPEQWGGGKEAARPLLAKAADLFNTFEPTSDISPDWGKEDCMKQLEACSTN